jgi:peptide/nickel transport system permease protein
MMHRARLLAIGRRLLMLLLVVWAAATLNFALPRFAARNPVEERLAQMASQTGGVPQGMEEMVKAYEARFGLDQSWGRQYLRYLGDIARLDLGYSIANYPGRVADQIRTALPWTIGLLGVSTVLAFLIGSMLGAAATLARAPRLLQLAMPVFIVLSAVPFYLLGLILVYFLAFRWSWFPIGGGRSVAASDALSWNAVRDILYHALLPGLSIVLASVGAWALGMRGMMITVQGEDYVTFAEAKGLQPRRIFLGYEMRNAVLPQLTALALSLGRLASGAVLVEMIFSYPGIGSLLFNAIKLSDYFAIYGCVLIMVLTIAIAMMAMELLYPLLDPRVRSQS